MEPLWVCVLRGMLVHPEESTMPQRLSRSRNVPTHFPGNPSNSRPGSGSLNVKGNQYLQVLDNDESPLRIIAKDITGLDSRLVRLSFDAYKPKGGIEGAVAIIMGISDVAANQTVGGIQIEPPNRLMPAGSGMYEPGRKFHVDIYYNETDERISYLTVDGKEGTLKSGTTDIWIDGRLKGAGKISNHRNRNDLTSIKSLRIETYTAPKANLYLDNLEIAIPQERTVLLGKN